MRSYTTWEHANLSRANLRAAKLVSATLVSVQLDRSDLADVAAGKARFERCRLNGAHATGFLG